MRSEHPNPGAEHISTVNHDIGQVHFEEIIYIFFLFSKCTCLFRMCLISIFHVELPPKKFPLSPWIGKYSSGTLHVCLSVCLPQRICSLFLPPLFSGNVGSNLPASKSTPLCTHSLLSWVRQPNKLFPVHIESSPPQEESKHSWKRRQRRAYRHYLQSWGQSFWDETSKSLPACSSSPYHPLCISASTEWRVPRHFPALCVPTAFLWSLLQLHLSCPSLPLLQAGRPPHAW